MKMLTRQRELARKQLEREMRKRSNDDIRIYNTHFAQKCNPYSGDTTVLPFGTDNKTSVGNITETDVLESVLFAVKYTHRRKDVTQLVPELVSDEVRDYWLHRIHGSVLRNAKAKAKCE